MRILRKFVFFLSPCNPKRPSIEYTHVRLIKSAPFRKPPHKEPVFRCHQRRALFFFWNKTAESGSLGVTAFELAPGSFHRQ